MLVKNRTSDSGREFWAHVDSVVSQVHRERPTYRKDIAMTCTHERYLEEQELNCRRIAQSANDGTQAYSEWLKTAEAILARRNEHIAVCRKCEKG